jgi:hypothetical protein
MALRAVVYGGDKSPPFHATRLSVVNLSTGAPVVQIF